MADHQKKRSISMVLTVIAAFLIYSGISKEPADENFTYAGILTLVYVLVGRNMFFVSKVKGLWSRAEKEAQAFHFEQDRFRMITKEAESMNMTWSDFRHWQIKNKVLNLYSNKSVGAWITVPLTSLNEQEFEGLEKDLNTCIPRVTK
jgi:hypothetical protein